MQKRALGLSFVVLALVAFGQSAWILAKAELAQLLLARAWDEKTAGSSSPKPWPWADTWPVALLRAPRLGEFHIVLTGASGRNMAFGPTHVAGTAAPGTSSNSVLTGHRDTHFAFLQDVSRGDQLVVETANGKSHHYRVEETFVADETDTWLLSPTEEKTLTLITCHPFDAIAPGGPGRYIVRAISIEKVTEPSRSKK